MHEPVTGVGTLGELPRASAAFRALALRATRVRRPGFAITPGSQKPYSLEEMGMKREGYLFGALLAVLCAAPLHAQQTATVRGRVVDEATKQPLAGVQVNVAGRGALTQADGRYVITGVPTGSDTVRSRRIGYAPSRLVITVVGSETVVADFSMSAEAVGLAEMIVTGYGQQTAGDITGAVSQITTEDFNPGRITVPIQLIQGKVAGVQVVDNNEPGGGTTIRIRGATSWSASSDPLYVIDGMPVGTGSGGGISAGRDPLNFLNPADIQSVTVLKDASAAAIYGANAANGVVLITTKSGGGGAARGTQVEYSSSYSSSSVTKLADVLNASQFAAAVAKYAASRVSMLGTASTNWQNLITRTSFGHEQNLSVTNSNLGSYYRLSLGYLNQDGILTGTNTERLSLALNYDQRLFSNHLDIKANLKGTRTNDRFTPGDVLGNARGMAPTQPVYDPNNVQGYGTGYWDWNTAGASASNPMASLNWATDHGTTWRSMGNVQAEYTMPFWTALKANVNLGYDAALTNRQTFYPTILAAQVRQGHGSLTLNNNTQVNQLLEAYLNYSAPLGILPGNIDLTGGYSYSQSHSEYSPFNETSLGSDFLGDNGIPTALNVNNSKSVVDYKLISWFGRVNYNINDRYLVAASVRRDGSSRFGTGQQWGVFPSVSLAWRLSQEPVLRDIRSLSDLKLRASWATTGNQAFGDYLQYPTYSFSNGLAQYQFGNQFITTIRPSAVDPNIKWEETGSYNVGLDFGFLSQRFSGAIDWYTKKTTDMIFYVPVAAGTNFSNYVTTNVGSMKNTGIEVSLTARLLDGGRDGLGYTASFTASHNANTLLSINPSRSVAQIPVGGIGGGTGNTIQVLMPGQPINSFFVYKQLFDSISTSPTYRKPLEGQYADLNGDGKVNSSDLRPYHSPWPTLELGHTSSFTYRSFDLSFALRAMTGNYVYNNVAAGATYQALTGGGSPSNMSSAILKTGFVGTAQYQSDYFVEDASFLRMDNISLGYTFRYNGNPLRLYVTVQNAFTITGYSGVDPTAGLNGIDNVTYPRSRTVTGGLSVRF
jgi:iron complex outermembrane receptor protein